MFVYANVPYKIKSYRHILKNSKDTIDFDEELDKSIRKYRESIRSDGALLQDEKQQIHHVNFIEKILATVLAKVSNMIPGGGIWMNTQRPEWNDANNALVGNGISMVTLCYLHRFLNFFEKLLVKHMMPSERIYISSELMDFYKGLRQVLLDNEHLLTKERFRQKTVYVLLTDFKVLPPIIGLMFTIRDFGVKSEVMFCRRFKKGLLSCK